MKILTGEQIRELDKHTIENEPIASIDLMERAANKMADFLEGKYKNKFYAKFVFLIGKGNNGGDGLALARIMSEKGYSCRVILFFDKESLNENCKKNFEKLPQKVSVLYKEEKIGAELILPNEIIVDAIFGSGLKDDLSESLLKDIKLINRLRNYRISIDFPTGMKSEFGNNYQKTFHADLTLVLQIPKLAFLLPEAGSACGTFAIININLNKTYIFNAQTDLHYVDNKYIINNLKVRRKFCDKSQFGHALLIVGSEGMAGAAFLSAGGALRSGCGYVTTLLPEKYVASFASKYPSSLYINEIQDDFEKYDAIGIGCGLGQNSKSVETMEKLLTNYHKPIIFDADAINILAQNRKFLEIMPKNSIITPHLGELERLIGQWRDEEEKFNNIIDFAQQYSVNMLIKGAHTMICTPTGKIFFNSTGTPFMAKAGSGDVLTGLITGLTARGYDPTNAAILGAYFHGLAGEEAAKHISGESFNSAELINFIKI